MYLVYETPISAPISHRTLTMKYLRLWKDIPIGEINSYLRKIENPSLCDKIELSFLKWTFGINNELKAETARTTLKRRRERSE